MAFGPNTVRPNSLEGEASRHLRKQAEAQTEAASRRRILGELWRQYKNEATVQRVFGVRHPEKSPVLNTEIMGVKCPPAPIDIVGISME